jgi:haloacetate dehalogenase
MDSDASLFPGFQTHSVDVGGGVRIHALTSPNGPVVAGTPPKPPLLLLHGHPQTHALWHKVAPALAQHFSLVLVDLRGYGASSKPSGDAEHLTYSKRAMAQDVVRVMAHFGHARFAVLSHDRGSRVTHRLCMDHPGVPTRVVLLDIAPTLAMYEQTNEDFARAYWHWFFLIHPSKLPERAIEADPAGYIDDLMGARNPTMDHFDPRAMAAYKHAMAQQGSAHAMCEDYRAAASIDLVHDRADRDAGRRVAVPMLVLWGDKGVVHRCFKPLAEWQRVAADVRGTSLPSGHYIAEEAPQALLQEALPFLLAAAG